MKFSEFNIATSASQIDYIVGYSGIKNYRITPLQFLGGYTTLNFLANTGSGDVNLSSQNFYVLGTANEITTTGSGQTLSIGFPSTGVTLPNGSLATTQTIGDNSDKVATTAYVDAAVTAEDLDFSGDTGTGSVDLDSQILNIIGTTNEIETAASGQTLTIGLPDDVTVLGELTVSGIGQSSFAGQLTIPLTPVATTDAASKGYVDSKITAEDLDFAGDTGTGAVDLDSQIFTVAGTINEIETSASGQTLTIGLPDDVTIAGELTVSGTGQNSFGGQVTIPATPIAGTDAASKSYVDAKITAEDLDFTGDSGSGSVDLDSQSFSVTGGAVITTTASGQNLDIVHDNISRTDSSSSDAPSFGGTFTAVDSVSSSSQGHITSINLKTITVPTPTYPTVNNSLITITAGTNLNGGGTFTLNQNTPSTITVNLDTTITGLTSVTSTTFVGALQGNADTASALAASGNITLTGDTTSTGGPYTYTSGGNVAIATTIADTTVTGKVLTGVNLGTAQVISATDSILDAFGYLQAQITQLPQGLVYQGTWNASTNTPTLTSGTGTTGHFYIVSVAGSTNLDGITDWQVGDWAIFVEAGGTDTWQKIDNTSAITGTGATNKLAKWTGPTTLSTGLVEDDGTTVTIGNSGDLDVTGSADITGDLAWSTSLTDTTNTITITKFVDEADGITANDNDTSIPTSAAVKDYVDTQVGTIDTLAEVLANGNTTGGTDIAVSAGDDITFTDTSKALFGTGNDLKIFHDGFNSYIDNSGIQGALYIQNQNDDGNILFRSDDGSGGLSTYFYIDGSFERTVFAKDIFLNENVKSTFGNNSDLQIYHNGSNSFIENDTGYLMIRSDTAIYLRSATGNEQYITCSKDGAVDLYYNDSKKFETTSTGIEVTGDGIFGGSSFDDPNSYGRKIEIVDNDAVGLILNDTRDTNPMSIDNSGAVMNLRYNTTSMLALDGATSNATFNGNVTLSQPTNGSDAILNLTSKSGAGNSRTSSIEYDADNEYMYFKNVGTTVATMTSGGNVGIGISTIARGPLHVHEGSTGYSQVHLTNSSSGSTSNDGLTLFTNGNDAGLMQRENSYLLFGTNDTERMRIDSSGSVQLNSYGSGTKTGTAAYSLSVDSSGNIIETTSTSIGGTGTTNYVTKWLGANTIGDSVMYDDGTNVGIGTNSPTFQLSIENHATTTSTATMELDGKRTNGTDGPVGEMIFSNNGDTFATIAGFRDGADNSGSIVFQTQDSGTFGTRMTISSDGKVAIGTDATHNRELCVKGEIAAKSTGSTDTHILMGANDSITNIAATYQSSGSYVPMAFETSGIERMRIDTSGNVIAKAGTIQVNRSDDQTQYGIFGQDSSGGYISYHRPSSSLYENFRIIATNTSGSVERMRITSGGQVQVGYYNTARGGAATTFMTGKSGTTYLELNGGDVNGEGGILFADGSGGNYGLVNYSHVFDIMQFYTASVERLRIEADGGIYNNDTTGGGGNTWYGRADAGNPSTVTGEHNTSLGYAAGRLISSGSYNVSLGSFSLDVATTALRNTSLGSYTNSSITTGSFNVASGYGAAGSLTTGSNNVAVGYVAMNTGSQGAENTAVGAYSMANGTLSGNNNTAIGYYSGASITTGSRNTLIGNSAGEDITTANDNVVIGSAAGANITTGNDNTIVGKDSGNAITNGQYNSVFGKESGLRITGGNQNTLSGYLSGAFLTTGNYVTAMGAGAGYGYTGTGATFLGFNAGYASSSQSYLTAIGYRSLYQNTSGSNLVAVGYNSLYSNTTGSNNTALGFESLRSVTTGTLNLGIGVDAFYSVTVNSFNTGVGNSVGVFQTGSYNTSMGYLSNYGVSGGSTGSYNTTMGYYAGFGNRGTHNTFLGALAGRYNSTGERNTFVGSQAADNSVVTGSDNVALGCRAANNITSATKNVAIGSSSLETITSGAYNVAVGSGTGYSMIVGAENTLIGHETGYNLTGSYNACVGFKNLFYTTSGNFNASLGFAALNRATSSSNTAMGAYALHYLTSGTLNVAMGYQALFNTTSDGNTAVGYTAMKANTTGGANTAVGVNAGISNTTGSNNTFFGYEAGHAQTVDNENTYLGFYAGRLRTSGIENTIVGSQASYTAGSGNNNTLVGRATGYNLTTGASNTLIGHQSGFSMSTGYENTSLGKNALAACTTGAGNIGIGVSAGYNMGSGGSNIAIGYSAMYGSAISGTHNTVIGDAAGYSITSGGNNLLLGKDAGRSNSPSGTVTSGSNIVCLGNSSITDLYCADTTISSSDARDKTDIEDFNIGLDFVTQLQPKTYKWDKRAWYINPDNEDEDLLDIVPDGSKKAERLNVGMLAQDVLELEKQYGYGNDRNDMLFVAQTPDEKSYGLKYERLVPVLINAIKELKQEIEILKSK